MASGNGGRCRIRQARPNKAAPKQYMLNSYFDAMEIGGSQARKFVVTGNADNEVLWLNLERKVRSGLLDLNLSE